MRELCTSSLTRARITAAQGQRCLTETDRARAVLDGAPTTVGQPATTPSERIRQVDAILAAIEASLTPQPGTPK